MNTRTNVFKTICPFCLYGCELPISEINRGNYILRKTEYDLKSEVNQGRLCARGNAANLILENKKRLTYPIFNNKNIDWKDAINQITTKLKTFSPEEIAITYDVNNTIEELTSIFSFAQALKVDSVARTYLEPETFLSYTFSNVKYAGLKDIIESNIFLIIGDIFAKSPVISKPILNTKYADRNNRLYYIDSVKSKLAGFANKFLWVKPNTEPLVLLALIIMIGKRAKDILGDEIFNSIKKVLPQILESCEIANKDVEEIAQSLINIQKGIILTSIDFGKTEDPILLSALTQLLTLVTPGDKKFCAPALASIPLGKTGFGSIIEQIEQGKIKALINFGDIFPVYYPQFLSVINKLNMFVTTNTMRHSLPVNNYTLAIPSLLEKSGTINTLWGKQTIKPLAETINGSKPIPEIIDHFALGISTKPKPRLIFKSDISIDEIINRVMHYIENFKPNNNINVFGEESAYGYRGIFDDDSKQIKINSGIAQNLAIKSGDSVKLSIGDKEKIFNANITNHMPLKSVSISVNTPENRGLFPMRIDNITKEIIISSAKGKLIKAS